MPLEEDDMIDGDDSAQPDGGEPSDSAADSFDKIDPSTLPDELKAAHASMLKAYQRKSQKLSEDHRRAKMEADLLRQQFTELARGQAASQSQRPSASEDDEKPEGFEFFEKLDEDSRRAVLAGAQMVAQKLAKKIADPVTRELEQLRRHVFESKIAAAQQEIGDEIIERNLPKIAQILQADPTIGIKNAVAAVDPDGYAEAIHKKRLQQRQASRSASIGNASPLQSNGVLGPPDPTARKPGETTKAYLARLMTQHRSP